MMNSTGEAELHPNHPHHLPDDLRVALVHDWMNGMRGGERVLEQFCRLFPRADIYTLFHEPEKLSPRLQRMEVHESPLGRIPGARRHYRVLLPLFPATVRRFPTNHYDLVLSTSHCVAKGSPAPARGLHLSYIHSPMRYVWDHFEDYLSGEVLRDGFLRACRPWLRCWDRQSCDAVDSFAANSKHIAGKIREFWGRKSRVIYPPVRLRTFQPDYRPPEEYFLIVSALVPYKRIELAIEAARLSRRRVVIVGDGPERKRLLALSNEFVKFAGKESDEAVAERYRRCRALIFPGIEDFGITSLEAQASGRPVIAYRGGGVEETVLEGQTGTFFESQDAESLAKEMSGHDDSNWNFEVIRAHAEKFSASRFRREVLNWIEQEARLVW